jgi:hypothetical protein
MRLARLGRHAGPPAATPVLTADPVQTVVEPPTALRDQYDELHRLHGEL